MIGSINEENTVFIGSTIVMKKKHYFKVRDYDGNYYSEYSNKVNVIVNKK
ncbi:MAG: hypothetical protein MUO34_02360 [Ignavibacteriaceae bacterium]|nr:hypothetical protein [Ignavibacteriaceae bacterium]